MINQKKTQRLYKEEGLAVRRRRSHNCPPTHTEILTVPRAPAPVVDQGITACIPSKANRKVQIAHDQALYRPRHKVENMFGKLKDW